MTHSAQLTDAVSARLARFVAERASILQAIAPELDAFVSFSHDFLSGGKRFRALFAYWGWRAIREANSSAGMEPEPSEAEFSSIVDLAAALEMFHAAALVHDDIMDNSATRRGKPAAHKRFESLHGDAGYRGSAEDFGAAAALLFGDLLLGWSDELVDEAVARFAGQPASARARAEFNLMRTEVTVGQYLDVLEESAWATAAENDQLARAERVILYKSAKYSVEAPLRIGASLAGARAEQLDLLSRFGTPLGLAFQLRDDVLGVFGDPALTGKPAGDDLIEGKRTVLIALARARLNPSQRALLDELLGQPLSPQQVGLLQQTVRESGALDDVESRITSYLGAAETAIANGPLGRGALVKLLELAGSVAHRSR